MKRITGATLLALAMSSTASAQPEAWYQHHDCTGREEVTDKNRKRVDCLTDTAAIEYDFDNKHFECAAQAIYYGKMHQRQPMCVLIQKHKSEWTLGHYARILRWTFPDLQVRCLSRKGETLQC